MVEGMYVVVNVMLSLMSVMSPTPALCNLSLPTVVKLCTLGVLTLENASTMPKCQPAEIHSRDANLQYFEEKNAYIPSYTLMPKTGVYPLD